MGAIFDAVRASSGKMRWYVTSLMGDNAYAVYAAHYRSEHPDSPVVSESQFWRQRYADQDSNPGATCC